MTSLPARKLGLIDRGVLEEGARADVVLFDPETIGDTATYIEPHRYPVGISTVIVNGAPVVRDRRHTGALPGNILSNRHAAVTPREE